MKKTLIVYHSRSGNTRRVAQALARQLHADLDEIRIVQPLAGWLGYAMCAIESLAALPPALRPGHHRPSNYELVLIGTPVWFWNVSSPVRSWLEAHPLKHRLAFFCTMGGSGGGRAFATMAKLAGKEPVATLALTEAEVASGEFGRRLDVFVGELASTTPLRPPRPATRHRLATA
jgi:multimeric flavodoxin WrbA